MFCLLLTDDHGEGMSTPVRRSPRKGKADRETSTHSTVRRSPRKKLIESESSPADKISQRKYKMACYVLMYLPVTSPIALIVIVFCTPHLYLLRYNLWYTYM